MGLSSFHTSSALTSMSFDASPWAAPAAENAAEPTVASALEKEKTIKDIMTLRDGLRGLLVRVTEVEADNDKLKRENEMLATYVENLSVLPRSLGWGKADEQDKKLGRRCWCQAINARS